MRVVDLKVNTNKKVFAIVHPELPSYGIGCKVNEDTMRVDIIFGNILEGQQVNVIEKIDELPFEFLMWYTALMMNLKTVNNYQQDGQSEPIAPEAIAPRNGGIIYYGEKQ